MVPDYLTIAEAARLIEKRELSPVELVDSRLDRIANSTAGCTASSECSPMRRA